MNIKVLGGGCGSCEMFLDAVKEVVSKNNIEADIEYITDMEKIMGYGIMSMPALMIDNKLISSGRVLKPKDIEKLII
ncbi:MAG: thioredoxin family protein [Clostridiales bacterium]|nr:thioredoxin family protein [Clostridiales bacterium]